MRSKNFEKQSQALTFIGPFFFEAETKITNRITTTKTKTAITTDLIEKESEDVLRRPSRPTPEQADDVGRRSRSKCRPDSFAKAHNWLAT